VKYFTFVTTDTQCIRPFDRDWMDKSRIASRSKLALFVVAGAITQTEREANTGKALEVPLVRGAGVAR
jgi:hypothetical protein